MPGLTKYPWSIDKLLTLVDSKVVVVVAVVVVVHSIDHLEENKVLGLMEVVDKNRVVPT